jgi:hypothetical protein
MLGPDQVFKCVLDTLGQNAEADFHRFVVSSSVSKWFIAGDFVVDAPDRPNDTFAFTIFPYNAHFERMQAEIRRFAPKDIKQSKTINAGMLRYLRSAQRFSFCFIANKDREWFPGLAEARLAIDNSLTMMRHWGDAAQQREAIKHFEALHEDARANSFNVKLLGHMVLMNSLAAVIACLLIKHGAPEIIGWLPDRDKMTSAYKAIAHEFFSTNLSALCQSMSIDESRFKVMIGIPGPPEGAVRGNWYDDLIRVPDHIAGACAAWDIDKRQLPASGEKFKDVLQQVFADNPNFVLVRLRITEHGMQASRVEISRTPPAAI